MKIKGKSSPKGTSSKTNKLEKLRKRHQRINKYEQNVSFRNEIDKLKKAKIEQKFTSTNKFKKVIFSFDFLSLLHSQNPMKLKKNQEEIYVYPGM